MMNTEWNGKLMNAEENHREHPDTFEIAPLSERANVRPGDLVKLAFLLDEPVMVGSGICDGERMWVKIVSSSYNYLDREARTIDERSVRYTGILQNLPAVIDMDKYASHNGYCVNFGPEHVLDIRQK